MKHLVYYSQSNSTRTVKSQLLRCEQTGSWLLCSLSLRL